MRSMEPPSAFSVLELERPPGLVDRAPGAAPPPGLLLALQALGAEVARERLEERLVAVAPGLLRRRCEDEPMLLGRGIEPRRDRRLVPRRQHRPTRFENRRGVTHQAVL